MNRRGFLAALIALPACKAEPAPVTHTCTPKAITFPNGSSHQIDAHGCARIVCGGPAAYKLISEYWI